MTNRTMNAVTDTLRMKNQATRTAIYEKMLKHFNRAFSASFKELLVVKEHYLFAGSEADVKRVALAMQTLGATPEIIDWSHDPDFLDDENHTLDVSESDIEIAMRALISQR